MLGPVGFLGLFQNLLTISLIIRFDRLANRLIMLLRCRVVFHLIIYGYYYNMKITVKKMAKGYKFIVICPFCNEKHVHGDTDLTRPMHRGADCGKGGYWIKNSEMKKNGDVTNDV